MSVQFPNGKIVRLSCTERNASQIAGENLNASGRFIFPIVSMTNQWIRVLQTNKEVICNNLIQKLRFFSLGQKQWNNTRYGKYTL